VSPKAYRTQASEAGCLRHIPVHIYETRGAAYLPDAFIRKVIGSASGIERVGACLG